MFSTMFSCVFGARPSCGSYIKTGAYGSSCFGQHIYRINAENIFRGQIPSYRQRFVADFSFIGAFFLKVKRFFEYFLKALKSADRDFLNILLENKILMRGIMKTSHNKTRYWPVSHVFASFMWVGTTSHKLLNFK